MKRKSARLLQIGALAISASLLTSLSAHADTPPSPGLTMDEYRVALEQFKEDRQTFNQQIRLRDQQINQINQTLNATVNKIKKDAKRTMALAKSPEEKSAILTSQQNAIAAAIVDHDAAIANLGNPPTPPVEPMRPYGNPSGIKPANPGQPSPGQATPGMGINKKVGAKREN